MYRKSFPSCKVTGKVSPVPYAHMISRGAVPHKCNFCEFLFEGECTRNIKQVDGYSNLDHGPCGIEGPTEPEIIAKSGEYEVFVPKKCSTCSYLKQDDLRGYVCSKDQEIWRDFPRNLDWGGWET